MMSVGLHSAHPSDVEGKKARTGTLPYITVAYLFYCFRTKLLRYSFAEIRKVIAFCISYEIKSITSGREVSSPWTGHSPQCNFAI